MVFAPARNALGHKILLTALRQTLKGHHRNAEVESRQTHQQRPSCLPACMGIVIRLDFLLDLGSFFTSQDDWLDYRHRELNNYHLKLKEAPKDVKFWHTGNPQDSFFLCFYGITKIVLELNQIAAGLCTYHAFNKYLLMCSFYLLWFWLDLVKILDVLWNSLWIFF